MNRFFVAKENVNGKVITIDTKDDVHHIKNVLRLKVGDYIEISNGINREFSGPISIIESATVEVTIEKEGPFGWEPNFDITLFQGMPKHGKMDLIIQKCVELGVSRIVPVYMDRSVVKKKDINAKKIERLNGISLSAAKQSKRGIVPAIEKPMEFKEIDKELKELDLVVFPYENEKNTTLKKYLETSHMAEYKGRNFYNEDKDEEKFKREGCTEETRPSIGVVIGPEGGFAAHEVKTLEDAEIMPVSIGKTILRTETAGMATITMILYQFEQ